MKLGQSVKSALDSLPSLQIFPQVFFIILLNDLWSRKNGKNYNETIQEKKKSRKDALQVNDSLLSNNTSKASRAMALRHAV